MRMLSAMVACVSLACGATTAQGQKAKIGEAAPAIALEALGQAPEGARASWALFRGTPVVLEFWATWCGPCVASIPHLNELTGRYEGRVRFISVTNEDRETVEKFLKKTPIAGWIGYDTDHSMFDSYGASSIPHTVLVDATGVVRAITHARKLTEEALDNLLAGRKVGLEDKSQSAMSLIHSTKITIDGPAPLQQAIIRPTTMAFKGTRQSRRNGTRTIFGYHPEELVQKVFGLTAPRMELDAKLPEQKYEADFKNTGRPDLRDEIAKLCVLSAFGLEKRVEAREVEALEIRALPGLEDKIKVYEPGSVSGSAFHGDDEEKGVSQIAGLFSASTLVGALESMTGMPVVNADLDKAYGIPQSTTWKIGDIDAMQKLFRETLGIEVRRMRATIDVTVFTQFVESEAG